MAYPKPNIEPEGKNNSEANHAAETWEASSQDDSTDAETTAEEHVEQESRAVSHESLNNIEQMATRSNEVGTVASAAAEQVYRFPGIPGVYRGKSRREAADKAYEYSKSHQG